MPVEMRRAVVAEEGKVFVRADLRQIEPRVLAAISGDARLARACLEDDLYAPVAEQLAVDRAIAKVAVLGAMYGQTTGVGARALRRLEATYPVAMSYLSDADRSAQAGKDLRTYGGRLVKMWSFNYAEIDEKEARRIESARGRYGRNAMVQGAAAELFKVWAVTLRARSAACDAETVLFCTTSCSSKFQRNVPKTERGYWRSVFVRPCGIRPPTIRFASCGCLGSQAVVGRKVGCLAAWRIRYGMILQPRM